MKNIFLLITFFCSNATLSRAQNLYFPPLSATATWDTTSPASLGWCTDKIDSLYNFLEQEDSRAFLLLKDGKIVLEKYFGTFTQDSIWYWASAGKSMKAFLVGKAQEEGYLAITDKTNTFLGVGFTACTPAQEDAITIRHQLQMTTGLDDGVPDNGCTLDTCLQYLAAPGSRWAYHNAPYTLLSDVLDSATGSSLNAYTQTRLKSKIGMNGTWIHNGFNDVYFSTPRSMARYGLLVQNDCIWNTDTLLHDTAFIHQMTATSQPLNQSYGYLWWLSGKASYRLPSTQQLFPGPLMPASPPDMASGLGKNGQMVCVSKATGLVMVRMGNAASSGEISPELCNSIWGKAERGDVREHGRCGGLFGKKRTKYLSQSGAKYRYDFAGWQRRFFSAGFGFSGEDYDGAFGGK